MFCFVFFSFPKKKKKILSLVTQARKASVQQMWSSPMCLSSPQQSSVILVDYLRSFDDNSENGNVSDDNDHNSYQSEVRSI